MENTRTKRWLQCLLLLMLFITVGADKGYGTTISIAQTTPVSGTDIVCYGASVTLTATPTPAGSYNYQWYRNTGSGYTAIGGATSTTYSFTAGTSGYSYECELLTTGNVHIVTSSGLTMTVQSPVISASTGTTFCDNTPPSSITFSDATCTGCTYVWKKNGSTTVSTSSTYTLTTSGYTSPVVENYTVITTDPNGCVLTSPVSVVTAHDCPACNSTTVFGGAQYTVLGQSGTINQDDLFDAKYFISNPGGTVTLTCPSHNMVFGNPSTGYNEILVDSRTTLVVDPSVVDMYFINCHMHSCPDSMWGGIVNSNGTYTNVLNNIIEDADTALSLQNYSAYYNLDIESNWFNRNTVGIAIENSGLGGSPTVNYNAYSSVSLSSYPATWAAGCLLWYRLPSSLQTCRWNYFPLPVL